METRKLVVVLAAVTAVSTVVALTLSVRSFNRRSERRRRHAHRILRRFARDCATPVQKLRSIANDVVSDMRNSLSSPDRKCGGLQMLPCGVASLPTGEEKGLHYGINLRGDNFLILQAKLGGKNEPVTELSRQEITIPVDVINGGTSKDLFDLIGLELAKFMTMHGESTRNNGQDQRKLGFTISQLPVVETSASMEAAIKVNGSSIGDAAKEMYVNEINECLEKHGVDLRVVALVDDTIGVLAGGRYHSRESVAAVTLGMGTNAAYVESSSAVEKWPLGKPHQSSEIVVDMQWGKFYSSNLPVTEFDLSLDTESSNPGCRRFEKLVSGMYLGEIVRRVLLKIARETCLFGDLVPPKLSIPYLLRSPDMAAMHQDMSEDYEVINEKLKEIFEITNSDPVSREIVSDICDIVAQRGARLVGAGIIGILNKLERLDKRISIVTVDGGVYEHYRVFRSYLNGSVWEMLGNEHSDNVILEHSHGGSGAGAVFLAALHASPSNSNN